MNRKAMALLPVLLIVLSMAGFAYAHWSDVVYIEGTVKMGDFLVGWLDVKECEDIDLYWPEPKEVATLTCELEDPETGVHHEPVQTVYHTLNITIVNAYPQYCAFCKVDLKNAGTIPAHIVDIIVTPGAGLKISDMAFDTNGNPIGWLFDDAATDKALFDLWVEKQETELSLVCNQLEPCTEEPVDIWINWFTEDVEECHTYTFTVEITAVQWNKA